MYTEQNKKLFIIKMDTGHTNMVEIEFNTEIMKCQTQSNMFA